MNKLRNGDFEFMKREYIIKNPEKVGMGKKRVYKEIRDIDVTPSTGEIVRESKIECTWVD